MRHRHILLIYAVLGIALALAGDGAHAATSAVHIDWIRGSYTYGAQSLTSTGSSAASSAAPNFDGAGVASGVARITATQGASIVVVGPATPTATQTGGIYLKTGDAPLLISIQPGQEVAIISATDQPVPSPTATLPTNAAQETGGNLAAIASSDATVATDVANIPAKGQAAMSASTPVAIASDQSALTIHNYGWTGAAWDQSLVDSFGRWLVAGAAADSAAVAGNPLLMGGEYLSTQPTYTNGLQTTFQTDPRGNLLVALVSAGGVTSTAGVTAAAFSADAVATTPVGVRAWAVGYGYNGTSLDRLRTTQAYDTAATGLGAVGPVLEDSAGAFSAIPQLADFRQRVVSAANTATTITIDLRNLHDSLAISGVCSAGTATLTVAGSADNTNFITLDSLSAATPQIKQYTATTVGATVTLSPLAFRYVQIVEGTCGASNTSTLTLGAK